MTQQRSGSGPRSRSGTIVDPDTGLVSLLPRTVRRWVVLEPQLPARTVEGTVVSADISGFTRLAEELASLGGREAAEALIWTINRCFEPMIARVEALGGDVLKLGGDALFALFPGDDSAIRAATWAAGIVADLDDVNRDLSSPLSMTVGAACGSISLVLAGSARRDLVVRGTTVDRCLALESEAEPGEVLICAETAARLPASWVELLEEDLHALDRAVVSAESRGRSRADATVTAGEPEPTAALLAATVGPELTDAFDAFVGTIGEIRLVTVAFVHLPTTELDDDAIAAVVGRLMELCSQHGVVMLGSDVAVGAVKFMLSSGAPTSGEDDEDAMLRVLAGLVLDPALPAMTAGVNRGLTYAGFLGSERNRTFTTMGDPTNLAARLLGRADPRSVVVAQSVLDHATAGWTTTELAPILVRGRLEPVVIHRLLGSGGGKRAARPRPQLVSRDRELRRVDEALSDARRGVGQVIEFRGRRGVGLSRLLDEVDQRRPDGFVRFRVDGRANSDSTPYDGIRSMFCTIIGIDHDLDPRLQLQELNAWITRTAPELIPFAPLLAPMIGAEAPPTPQSAAIEPEFRLDHAAGLMADLLARTLTTPTVFVTDDLHRLDSASLSVLEAIALEAGDRPWVVVSSARLGTEPMAPSSDVLTVEPLAEEQVISLVAAVAPDLADDTRRQIAHRCGGNPFFAVELAGAAAAGTTNGSLDLLDTIEGLVTAQIDRLGHRHRVIIRTASVVGQAFDVALLARVTGTDRAALGLDRLAGLVEEVDDAICRFRASVVWEVAYGGLSNQRRAELHADIADQLGRQGAEPAVLAWHHSRAGNHQDALRHGRAAAEQAVELGLMVEATDQLVQVVDSLDHLDARTDDAQDLLIGVLSMLFEVGTTAGRHADAIAAGDRAVALLDDGLPRVRLLTRVAWKRAEAEGSYDREIQLLNEEFNRIADEPDAAAHRAWLGETLAVLKNRRGDVDDALRFAEQARIDAELSGQQRPLTSALLIRHGILGDRGDAEQYRAWDELLAAAEELDDPRFLTFAHNNRGLDLQNAGDWNGALAHYEAAADYAGRSGDRYRGLFPSINRAALRSDQGHRDEARVDLDRLRRDAGRDASGFATAWANRELGRLEAFAGNRDQARARLDVARSWFVNAGNVVNIHEVDLSLVAADLAVGRSQDVLDQLAAMEPPDDQNLRLAGWMETLAGFARLQRDQPDEALAAFQQAVDNTSGRYRFGEALALFGQSEAERFVGRTRSAHRTRADADAILHELGVVELPYIPLPR